MSTVLRRPNPAKVNGDVAERARAAAISQPRPNRGAVRRRWGRIGAGAGLMVLGGWFAAAMYFSAGDRSDIVVLAADVGRYEPIERADLIVGRISTDASVATIPAERIDQIVGRVAATDLSANSILTESQLLKPEQKLLGADEAIVGVLLGPGDGQMNLTRGTKVTVVVRSPTGAGGTPTEVAGWVFDASAESLNSRERPVELAVPKTLAGTISAAAADKRVTIVALSE